MQHVSFVNSVATSDGGTHVDYIANQIVQHLRALIKKKHKIDVKPQEIKNHIPEFEISYKRDYRQEIADSWPHNIDDSAAFKDWNWKSSVNLQKMTSDMLKNIETLITE